MTDPTWTMRPARDLGLTPGARWRSLNREPGLGSVVIATAWQWLTRGYLACVHRITIEGLDNLPPPPFVMVGNHSSHLDALALAAALPASLRARAFTLAAGDTFFTHGVTAAFASYAINALPVWRKRTSAGDLDAVRARLHGDSSVLIVFPEGTRSRTGLMAGFKPGIGAMVAGTAVPVVPCYLDGAFRSWPPGRKLPRPARLRLNIGVPLQFKDVSADRAGMVHVARACEDAVRQCAPDVCCDRVQAPG